MSLGLRDQAVRLVVVGDVDWAPSGQGIER